MFKTPPYPGRKTVPLFIARGSGGKAAVTKAKLRASLEYTEKRYDEKYGLPKEMRDTFKVVFRQQSNRPLPKRGEVAKAVEEAYGRAVEIDRSFAVIVNGYDGLTTLFPCFEELFDGVEDHYIVFANEPRVFQIGNIQTMIRMGRGSDEESPDKSRYLCDKLFKVNLLKNRMTDATLALQEETINRNTPKEARTRNHVCVCGKDYAKRTGLQMHVYKCSLLEKMTEPCVCTLCDSTHETKYLFRRHLLNSACTQKLAEG